MAYSVLAFLKGCFHGTASADLSLAKAAARSMN